MVSNASDDLPDPDTPVTTDIRLCGMSSEMFLRLWTRAPRIRMESCTGVFRQFQYSVGGPSRPAALAEPHRGASGTGYRMALHGRLASDKQARRDVEVRGEFARMRLADRSLSVEHVGNNAARSEYGNQIALPNAAILHENAEGLDGLGMAEPVFRLLELAAAPARGACRRRPSSIVADPF